MVAPFAAVDGDKVGGMKHARNGIEESGTDPSEDGAVRGDAESEREHGHKSETGRLREHAEGVAEVVNQGITFPSRSWATAEVAKDIGPEEEVSGQCRSSQRGRLTASAGRRCQRFGTTAPPLAKVVCLA